MRVGTSLYVVWAVAIRPWEPTSCLWRPRSSLLVACARAERDVSDHATADLRVSAGGGLDKRVPSLVGSMGSSKKSSGAMYGTVPVFCEMGPSATSAKPQSTSLTLSFSSSAMFSGLTSRWAKPRACTYDSASTSCEK